MNPAVTAVYRLIRTQTGSTWTALGIVDTATGATAQGRRVVGADLVPRPGRSPGRIVHRESIQDSIQMGYAVSLFLYFFGSTCIA